METGARPIQTLDPFKTIKEYSLVRPFNGGFLLAGTRVAEADILLLGSVSPHFSPSKNAFEVKFSFRGAL